MGQRLILGSKKLIKKRCDIPKRKADLAANYDAISPLDATQAAQRTSKAKRDCLA